MLESQLGRLLTTAMSEYTPDQGGNGFQTRTNLVAQVVMHEVESIRTRLSVIDKSLGRLLPSDLAAEWERIKPLVRKRGIERNTLAHGLWAVTPEYPDDLLLVDDDQRTVRYSEADLKDTWGRIIDASNALHCFISSVLAAKLSGRLLPEMYRGGLPR